MVMSRAGCKPAPRSRTRWSPPVPTIGIGDYGKKKLNLIKKSRASHMAGALRCVTKGVVGTGGDHRVHDLGAGL